MIYDDGTYDVESGGALYAFDAAGAPVSMVNKLGEYYLPTQTDGRVNSYGGFSQDRIEQAKFGQFYPGKNPFWENFAMYGATRALDAAFGPKVMPANTNGTYAGADGRTRTQGRLSTDPQSDNLMLLVLAGVAFFVLAA